jgi:hypothetical protein
VLQSLITDPNPLSNMHWQLISSLTHPTVRRRRIIPSVIGPLFQTIIHLHLPAWNFSNEDDLSFRPSTSQSSTPYLLPSRNMPPMYQEVGRGFLGGILAKFGCIANDATPLLHRLDIHSHSELAFVPEKKSTDNDWEDWVSGGDSVWDTAERMHAP